MNDAEQLVAPKPAPGRLRLALWILAPIVGLVVVFDAVTGLPATECGEACLAGILLAGIALLGLLVVWIRGRGVEGAGSLLPLYLIGAGLLYPVVLLIGLLAQSGIGC